MNRNIATKLAKPLLIACRITAGMVFIFSGFVKGVDPLGTTYKLVDYFSAFHVDFLSPFAFTLSIVLNMSEFVLGIALVLGLFTNFFTRMALVYMAFFTPLTFALAIYNPVTDCGCFGDAIVMTNWETFYKNIIITAIVLLLFSKRMEISDATNIRRQWTWVFVSIFAFLLLSIHSYRHLPIIDFRPYKVGTYIPEAMKIPEGAPRDSFETVHTYEKNGVLSEFSTETIPWQDTTWHWVATDSRLIRQGYHPPIHDFAFINTDGEDVTQAMLQDTSFVFLAISHDLDRASDKGLKMLRDIYDGCRQNQFNFYFATASPSERVTAYLDSLSLPFNPYAADDIMLKTVVRSNPGLVLLRNGTIIGKWHYNDLPDFGELPVIHFENITDTGHGPTGFN
jgi:uncharacterized membrane protein YphA (DoxX/SURF4 family)